MGYGNGMNDVQGIFNVAFKNDKLIVKMKIKEASWAVNDTSRALKSCVLQVESTQPMQCS